jgi:nucleotide-binding universal stress UspA family protein
MSQPTPHSSRATPEAPRIVVGVDGSACSKAALKWAITQARLVGATVEAVGAWQDPAMYGGGMGWAALPYDGESLAVTTQKVLDQSIDEVRAQFEAPVEISTRVMQGHPAQMLPEAAVGAQLLVVGSRGHGAFAGLLLGSVSQHCVQHMSGPVAVIPLTEAVTPA